MLLLITNHALAAPGLVFIAAGFGQEMSLRLRASGWAARFDRLFSHSPVMQAPKGWDGKGAPPRPRPDPQVLEKKEDRERKIFRVQIFPGDITIETGEQAVFTAVAYDKDGSQISGLDVSRDGLDEDKNQPITVSQQATFATSKPGKFKLTADVAGRKAHVKVTVIGVERTPNATSSSAEPVSSHDKPKKIAMLAPTSQDDSRVAMRRGVKTPNSRQPLRAASSALASSAAVFLPGEDDYGWNSSNYTTSDDPGAERRPIPTTRRRGC